MKSQFLVGLATGQTLSSSFVSAVNDIQSYCKWVTSQSVTDATLNNTLLTIKTDATTWYNTIYPDYMNMPTNVITNGTQIDNDLSILISLATQLQAGSTPAIVQQINQYATSLTGILQNLSTSISTLANLLVTFQGKLNNDWNLLNNSFQYMDSNLNSLNQQLATLYGQLNSMQNATCPSQTSINACEDSIRQIQDSIGNFDQFEQLFENASFLIKNAIVASGFLAGFWQSFSIDIQACVKALSNVASESGTILQIDLQNNKTNWDAMQQNLLQIIKQIPPK
jgi:hypothetical protein